MQNQPATDLKSKTYLGLLLAQFTATFNDQAIHMVAVFYAVDMLVRFVRVPHIDDKAVVSIVTACFITPFLLFSSFAGMLGDKFSKRNIIVFWKVAEVAMMSIALFGLALPHLFGADSPSIRTVCASSALLVIAAVFLMGMHSTFFVPAKLGVMPEIMHLSILSRANGILEGTSFIAQILGTSFGGMLYALLKGEVRPESPPTLVLGQEWLIGAILLGLAIVGTATAYIMQPVPPAAPDRPLTWNWWAPLRENLGIVSRSKPLLLSATGIAFCVFMTLFLRQTLLLQGEMVKELNQARTELSAMDGSHPATDADEEELRGWLPPRIQHALREPELRVSMLFVLVGIGVGAGSLAAGFLSGHRVELGLLPIGGLLIIGGTLLPAITLNSGKLFAFCLFLIGLGAGFYLVPMYTLLQQRAPKESKGNVIAASNFINVTGGVLSVLVFFAVAGLLDRVYGAHVAESHGPLNVERLREAVDRLQGQFWIPRMLYLTASILTAAALCFLIWRLPDFLLRSVIWIRALGHNRLRSIGTDRLSQNHSVLMVTNCGNLESVLDLVAALDRFSNIILVENTGGSTTSLVGALAARSGVTFVSDGATHADWSRLATRGQQILAAGGTLAVNIPTSSRLSEAVGNLLVTWRETAAATWVPVYSTAGDPRKPRVRHPRIIVGEPQTPDADPTGWEQKIEDLATDSIPENAAPITPISLH